MNNKKKFIEFTFQKKALKFGQFQLKSGRISPYFFNSSVLYDGENIFKIGIFYANLIKNLKLEYNVLFGSAYKGISIAIATSIALKKQYNINIPFVFNRKEEKQYGEKGIIIGQNLKNKKIIIVDDVITSGTELRKNINIIESQGGKLSSTIVLLDRQEKKIKSLKIEKSIKNSQKYQINSIITMQDLIFFLKNHPILKKYMPNLVEYRKKYGSS